MCRTARIEVPARPTQELRLAGRAGVDVRCHRYAAHLRLRTGVPPRLDGKLVTGLIPGDFRNQLREANGWVDGLPLSLMVMILPGDPTGVWQRLIEFMRADGVCHQQKTPMPWHSSWRWSTTLRISGLYTFRRSNATKRSDARMAASAYARPFRQRSRPTPFLRRLCQS